VLFFAKHPPRSDGKPNSKEVWIYDFRTNRHFTWKNNPLKPSDLDDSSRATPLPIAPSAKRRNALSGSRSPTCSSATS